MGHGLGVPHILIALFHNSIKPNTLGNHDNNLNQNVCPPIHIYLGGFFLTVSLATLPANSFVSMIVAQELLPTRTVL